jgi:cytochrome c-type protein NapB
MRGASGKSMSRGKTILIGLSFYGLLAGFFFVQNALPAKEKAAAGPAVEPEKAGIMDPRARLRAFYTAPPVIPHEIEARDSRDCLRCHLNVTRLDDGRAAMRTPHPQFSNCLQCHVPGLEDTYNKAGSHWQGLEEPRRGDRWFTTTPPTIPHRVRLRENCLSCHGPENPDTRIRTPHPERTSCLQCHVPDYRNQF